MSKLTASYLAGFTDGEGYISLRIDKRRPSYQAILKIASTNESIIKWIKESYGGWYYKRKSSNENHKDSYYWTLTGPNLEPFLRKIYPYLKLKRRQCELVLEKIKLQKLEGLPHKNISRINQDRIGKRKCNLAYRESVRKRIQEIYLELRQLNKRGTLHVERPNEATLRGSDGPSL